MRVLTRNEFSTCIQMIVNSRKVWSSCDTDTMDEFSDGSRHVEVLVTCRFLLKFLHLCNKDRVHIKLFNSKKVIEIPNFIIFGGFAAPIAYESTMLILALLSDTNVEKRPSLMCVILSNLQAFLTYVSMVKTNRFTIETIEYIQAVVDKRCDSSQESYEIYAQCEARHERLVKLVWKIGFIFLIIIFGASMSFPLCYAIFGYPAPDSWYLPIPSKTWINTNTYFGYTFCLIEQLTAYVPWTLTFIAPLMLYMGLCLYIVAHSEDLKTILRQLDDQILLTQYAQTNTSGRRPSRLAVAGTSQRPSLDRNIVLKEILKEAVCTHRDLIKMLENIRSAVSGYLFYQFIFTLNYIAFFIFVMDGMLTKTSDFNDLIVYNFLVAATCVNFILCYYADRLTFEASDVADAMYNTAWYDMPIPQQKMLLLPIGRSQKLIQLTGYGVYTYSLQNFGRIVLRSQATRLVIFSLTGKNPQLLLFDRV